MFVKKKTELKDLFIKTFIITTLKLQISAQIFIATDKI